MKKLLLVLSVLMLAGCSTAVGHKAAEGHKAVFGCWPKGYEPPRVLEAQGPKDTVERSIFGFPCGMPAYKRPACSDVPTYPTPAPMPQPPTDS